MSDTVANLVVLTAMTVTGGLALARAKPVIAGTTLVAPWWWNVAALLTLATCAATDKFNSSPAPAWQAHLAYAAAAVTFCPWMAVLGAKRPQDVAWQFVVATLLVVLLLPSAEALLYRPQSPLELHAARAWFLWLLIALGLANALPTRDALRGVLIAAAQVVLLAPQLPLLESRAQSPLLALALFTLALSAWPRTLRRRSASPDWSALWREFRDAFGAMWALRVAERFNVAARMNDWPVNLRWSGFVSTEAPGATPALSPAMQTNLLGLLRRFVSRPWIDARADCTSFTSDLD